MNKKTRMRLEKTLMDIGIAPSLLGFKYICMAVDEINSSSRLGMLDIYSNIANEYQTTRSGVERCIRHSITKITDAGYEQLGFSFKTNSEFLYSLALKLKMEEEEDEHN